MYGYSYSQLCFKSQHLHTCKSLTQEAEPPTLPLITFTLKIVFSVHKCIHISLVKTQRFWKLLTKI